MFSGSFIRNRSTKLAAVVLGLVVIPVVSGCGKAKEKWDTAYPTKGVVKFRGNPVADAEIAFFPQGESVPATIRPRARTKEDGSFEVWTYQPGDGAPEGKYKITVTHTTVKEYKGVAINQPNDLPPKYATQQTTDLVAEIGPQPNEIPPLELK